MRKYILFGAKPKYPALSWWENFASGHVNIGKITIFGANAMCWIVQIRTKRYGVIVITLPSIRRKRTGQKMFIYFSPDGTPNAATLYIGNKRKRLEAKLRKVILGHNFNNSWQSATYIKNRRLTNRMDSLTNADIVFFTRCNGLGVKCFL